MALTSPAVVTGGTLSVTGGTALSYVSAGPVSSGQVDLYVAADTDFRTRRTASFKAKAPTQSIAGPNGYTQARASATMRFPKLLANGKITVNTIRVEMAYDPETTQTEIQQMMDVGAQALFDSDFTSFWKALSLS